MAELQIEVTHVTITRTKTSVAAKEFCCTPMSNLWNLLDDRLGMISKLVVCPFCQVPVVRLPDVYRDVEQQA
jgi:hypothetical protein